MLSPEVPSDGKQSSDPESPAAAIAVWPCDAMRANMPLSVWMSARFMSFSQMPQLVVTTWALSSLAIRLSRSSESESVFPLGAS
jgi:hypothetical protein